MKTYSLLAMAQEYFYKIRYFLLQWNPDATKPIAGWGSLPRRKGGRDINKIKIYCPLDGCHRYGHASRFTFGG
jgi:hypothetical protein